ncbi:MAG: hypothetical protein IKU47_08080 [Oscillospiraceae bacterium]|nr:hypothetical protein [Oscillospiraceae bacterium]
MTEFKTQEFPKENRHCLQFETDNRGYFLRVQTAAQECIDHKPLTNFERIKAMSLEEMAMFITTTYIGADPWCDRHCEMQGEDNCNRCLAKWLNSEVQEE